MLEDYFQRNGRYPISATEDRIYWRGREESSILYRELEENEPDLHYILDTQGPETTGEDVYFGYISQDGTSYVLYARLEQGQEHECDRAISQDLCFWSVRP